MKTTPLSVSPLPEPSTPRSRRKTRSLSLTTKNQLDLERKVFQKYQELEDEMEAERKARANRLAARLEATDRSLSTPPHEGSANDSKSPDPTESSPDQNNHHATSSAPTASSNPETTSSYSWSGVKTESTSPAKGPTRPGSKLSTFQEDDFDSDSENDPSFQRGSGLRGTTFTFSYLISIGGGIDSELTAIIDTVEAGDFDWSKSGKSGTYSLI